MKIAVTTFFTNSYEPLAEITIPVLRKWCSKHDYHISVHIINNDTFPHFIKTNDAKRLLNEGFDIVFAIENDILITNLNCKIEDFINDTHDFFLTKDMNGFNSGSFIIKNTEWARKWLSFINNRNDGKNDEQDIIQQYGGSIIFEKNILELPHPSINSIPYKYYDTHGYVHYNGQPIPTHEQGNWEHGDFTMHLPAMPLERRIELFTTHLNDIIYE